MAIIKGLLHDFGKAKPQQKFTVNESGENSCLLTKKWYETEGWMPISQWLTELTPNEFLKQVYIENFDVIPPFIDKKALCALFNEDGGTWKMGVDNEGNLICQRNR